MSTNNLLSLFPGLKYSQINSIPVYGKVSQSLSAGAWTFNNTNTGAILNMRGGNLYYIDNYTTSSNVPSEYFHQAIGGTSIQFQFQADQNFSILNKKPVQFADYVQELPLGFVYVNQAGTGASSNQYQTLSINVKGVVNQTPDIASLGIITLNIMIYTTIYEISDHDFITKWVN